MTREDVAKLIRMNFVLYKLGSKPLTRPLNGKLWL